MADDFKYDVFISYSSANKDWVRKDLLSALEKAGLKVCIDFRDFKVGKPALKNMRDGILESRHTLLVLTDAYLKSGWTEFESLISQTLDPANHQTRVIPLLKEKSELPLEISYLTYVNFYNPDDWDIAWKQLLEALGSPIAPPPAPVDIRWFYGHRYGDIKNFTGRATEMKMLDEWLNNDKDNLLVLRALGGFGKSALTWQWFNNKVDKEKWQTAVWWSFYEKESGFESFLAETLKHLEVEVKASARLQVNDLLEALRGANILIVLDGFERLLRQYERMDAALQSDDEDAETYLSQRDCSSPLTETFLRGLSGAGTKSKVLMTTRLCPRVLESADGKLLKGCREEPLAAFSPEDAVEFFRRQGIKGTHAEMEAACEPYGYHPLSLRLLAGFIKTDLKKPFDIIAASQINVNEDLVVRRHHVLEAAFENLTFTQQLLIAILSKLGNSFDYEDIWKSRKKFPPYEDKDLQKLIEFGLVDFFSEEKRFTIHMIVRKYMVDRVPQNTFSSELEKKPVLKIYPTSGPLGSKAQITGANFVPLDKVTIYIMPSSGANTLLPIFVEKDGTFQYIFDTLKFKGLDVGICKFLGEGKASGQTKTCGFHVTSSLHLERPLRTFICYSKLDKKIVQELAQKLRAQGIDPWLDEESLLPGQDWEMEIEKAINNSDVIVTCVSNGSVNKPGYINKELKLALDVADKQPENTIFIIPLRLEDCLVPTKLNKWQWLNYFEPKGFEYLLRALEYQANRLGLISK